MITEKDGQQYHDILDIHLGYIPKPHNTENNRELMRILLTPLMDSWLDIKQLTNLPNIDKMYGAGLDFIGKNLVGDVSREVDSSIYGSDYLTDEDFRIVLKFAVIAKQGFPSLPNLRIAFSKFFSTGIYINQDHVQLQYVIDEGAVPKALLQVIAQKGLFPKPAGVNMMVIVKPAGEKFFNFPIGLDNNNQPIYRPYESQPGLIYGANYVLNI